MVKITNWLRHAWNAFKTQEDGGYFKYDNVGVGHSYRPDRFRLSLGNERSIIGPIYNRLAMDVANLKINHVRTDQNGRYLETIYSSLNECLSLSANLDQTGMALFQDAVMSMFDEGCVAIVPVDTTLNPNITGGYDILSLRVAEILEWYPNHVRVRIYNETKGEKEDLVLTKNTIAIIENPLYAIMNEPNSTLKRLIRKINLLDGLDEQSSSGKLDLIIQLPYILKTQARKDAAEIRRLEIEQQLASSKYGIAYTDGTEKVTQLNRPVENNLLPQIEYLTKLLYNQLGLTESIFDGTADEKTMLNYYNRTIEPLINSIVDEMKRKFLTKTARSQNQSITYFRDPFKLIPVKDLAEVADKFTRNEIMSSNDFRAVVSLKPSNQKGADELRNKNLNNPETQVKDTKKEEVKNEEPV